MFAAGAAYIGLLDDLARRYSFSCLVAVWSVVAEACLGLLMIVYSVVTQVLIVAPLLAIVLSLIRLVASHYGNAGGDAANAEKLKASLRIFYSLVLAQNALFYLWKWLIHTWPDRASVVTEKAMWIWQLG